MAVARCQNFDGQAAGCPLSRHIVCEEFPEPIFIQGIYFLRLPTWLVFMLVTLAEIVGKRHALVEQLAIDAGFKLLEVGGGQDKGDPPVEVLKSILGL